VLGGLMPKHFYLVMDVQDKWRRQNEGTFWGFTFEPSVSSFFILHFAYCIV
jgi:hypothetical protein